VFLVGLLASLLSACWPMPGAGPDRRSSNPYERDLTVDTVGRLTEAFRIPLEHGSGAPVATRAGLFVRDYVSISSFDPSTGASRWTTRVPSSEFPQDGNFTVSDPYVLDDDQRIVASATTWGIGGATFGDHVVLDAGTGDVERREPGANVGAVREPKVASTSYEHLPWLGQSVRSVSVRDLDTGAGWGGYTPHDPGIPGVVTLGDTHLYVTAGNVVDAYDPSTPCKQWSEEMQDYACDAAWKFQPGQSVAPVVIGDDDTIYVGTAAADGTSGQMFALRAGSGGIRWRSGGFGPVRQPPAMANGLLYAAAGQKLEIMVTDRCDFAVCPHLAMADLPAEATVQPVVAGGVVYVGTADGTVSAFDASGCINSPPCPLLWSANVGSPVAGGMAVANGKLYVGSENGLVGYRLAPA
jgi:outer membrane protein assembly factor BamB